MEVRIMRKKFRTIIGNIIATIGACIFCFFACVDDYEMSTLKFLAIFFCGMIVSSLLIYVGLKLTEEPAPKQRKFKPLKSKWNNKKGLDDK